jgi:hypothetical protein
MASSKTEISYAFKCKELHLVEPLVPVVVEGLQITLLAVRKSVRHLTIQINQPTRCNSFTSSLLDVYM